MDSSLLSAFQESCTRVTLVWIIFALRIANLGTMVDSMQDKTSSNWLSAGSKRKRRQRDGQGKSLVTYCERRNALGRAYTFLVFEVSTGCLVCWGQVLIFTNLHT